MKFQKKWRNDVIKRRGGRKIRRLWRRKEENKMRKMEKLRERKKAFDYDTF